MRLGRAISSGIVGAIIVVLLFLLAHYVLTPAADPSTLLGDVVWPAGGWLAWTIGAVAQLVLGAAAGIAYAIVFEFVFRHAGPLVGLAVALPHVVIAGFGVAWLPVGSGPFEPARAGAFLAFEGALAAAWFIVAHFVFGAIAGACYGETRHRASAPPVAWRVIAEGAEPGREGGGEG